MNFPTPAIVAERSAQQRLPRVALIFFCAAYLLPGLFGRDPWRNADLSAYGFMAHLATAQADWMHPTLGGIPADSGLLPYWLGALAIHLLPMLDPALAARLPFAVALALVLVLVWYSCYFLARTEAAQPVAFAFGGEAPGDAYARALADGGLLALIASLGMLLLGHETTPELIQLLGAALLLYGLAAAPYQARWAPLAVLAALPILAASGAPTVAAVWGLGALAICLRSAYDRVRALSLWLGIALVLALVCGSWLDLWAWRLDTSAGWALPGRMLSLLVWFAWPAWPLAVWTLWRWRKYLQRRHISVPLLCVLVPMGSAWAVNASDRALLLSLPALAVLASFALPTLRRSVSAMLDWYSVFFFSAIALFIWLYYLSMQTGWPAQPLANVKRLAQGFEPSFNGLTLAVAALASTAWLFLVRWRTAKHQHALWKSLVLPAGGVALCWLLLMTLWLPVLDYARSNRPLVERLSAHIPPSANCIAAPGQALSLIAALETQGGWRVDATRALPDSACHYALLQSNADQAPPAPAGWHWLGSVKRPTERALAFQIYMRQAAP